VIFRLGHHIGDGAMRVRRGTGHEQILASADDGLGDAGDLGGRLPLAEDHLREPLADVPMVVDAGKAEIFVGTLAQELKEFPVRCLRRSVAGAYLVEEGPELLAVHRAKWPKRIDFALSWTVT